MLGRTFKVEILELEENGRVYFKEWLNACTDQEQRMAKPMIECLDVIGIKCKFVKEIEPKGFI